MPTAYDDVTFGDGFNFANFVGCIYDGPVGATIAHSITINSEYYDTLHAVSGFTTNILTFDGGGGGFGGGNIDQPSGNGVSDINVTGDGPAPAAGDAFSWSGGILNSGPVKAALNLLGGTATLTGTDLSTGADLNLTNGFSLSQNNTGALNFNNNAGISLASGATWTWDSGTGNIVTTGTGIIMNNGGTFAKVDGGNTVVKSDLPFVNNNAAATLGVTTGTLDFTRAGPANGVSVLQNSGAISLGALQNGAILQVDKGLTMNGGALATTAGFTSQITVGSVYIHGGTVAVGTLGIGALTCDGAVTMDGGTYQANVDLTAKTASLWTAKSFLIGGTSTLTANSLNIPNVLPVLMPFKILHSSAKNGITGDFVTKNLGIGNTGKSYTAGPDANNQDYNLTTP